MAAVLLYNRKEDVSCAEEYHGNAEVSCGAEIMVEGEIISLLRAMDDSLSRKGGSSEGCYNHPRRREHEGFALLTTLSLLHPQSSSVQKLFHIYSVF